MKEFFQCIIPTFCLILIYSFCGFEKAILLGFALVIVQLVFLRNKK